MKMKYDLVLISFSIQGGSSKQVVNLYKLTFFLKETAVESYEVIVKKCKWPFARYWHTIASQ